MRTERRINFSDMLHRAVLLEEITQARGWHLVSVSPAQAKAKASQFGFYYGVVLQIAKQFLAETQGGPDNADGEIRDWSDEEADLWLKNELRSQPVVNKKTGELMAPYIPSKARWSTRQMYEYVDDVIALLRKNEWRVPPADPQYRERRRQAFEQPAKVA